MPALSPNQLAEIARMTLEYFEQMVVMIEPFVVEDPRACNNYMNGLDQQSYMRDWVQVRSDEVREIWE